MLVFIKKLFLFCTPFILLIGLEYFIDPFNYFSPEKDKKTAELKNSLARKKNTYLYRLIEYEQNPTGSIILGDSRAQRLMPDFFEEVNGMKIVNLAAGAGSLQDVINIFWDITSRHKLDTVYIGISIEAYSGTLLKDRVSAALEVKNSTPLYLMNKFTVENTMLILKSKLFKQPVEVQEVPFSREEFWKYELQQEDRYLRGYTYPKNYYNDLKKISDYCRSNKIKLVFIISPTHMDVQEKIKQFHLEPAYEQFRHDIESFGELYDFNWPNEITRDRKCFLDPLHSIDSVSRLMIREVVLNKPIYAKYTKPRS
jgi:hypothetical protein